MQTVYSTCSAFATFAFQDLLSYEYTSVGPRLFEQPEVAGVLDSLKLGGSRQYTPSAPLYVLHGTEDEVSFESTARITASEPRLFP
jgi:hypothetical protein